MSFSCSRSTWEISLGFMLSILNYSSVLFYELTPDEIELAGDASVQDGVLDLEYEAAYEGRVDFGFQDQPAAGLFLDQITETGLQCRSLSLSKRLFLCPLEGLPFNVPLWRADCVAT